MLTQLKTDTSESKILDTIRLSTIKMQILTCELELVIASKIPSCKMRMTIRIYSNFRISFTDGHSKKIHLHN